MARGRMIRPGLPTSEHFVSVSRDARLTFVLMQMFCDDRGVCPASPAKIKMRCFPADDCSIEQVGRWCTELVEAHLVLEYAAEGGRYWFVYEWSHTQKLDRPTFRYPKPPQDKLRQPPARNPARVERTPVQLGVGTGVGLIS